MECVICGGPVPPARLSMNPRVITCSGKCTNEHNRRLRRAGAARQRRRKAKESK